MDYNTYANGAGIKKTDTAKEVQEKIKAFAKKIVKTDKTAKSLGNQTLKQIGVDEDEPVQTVFYSDGGCAGG